MQKSNNGNLKIQSKLELHPWLAISREQIGSYIIVASLQIYPNLIK